MGGGQSIASTYRGVYNLDPSLMEFKKDFETLCLKNSDVKCLYDVYHKIDNAKNNAVEIDAIFLVLEITNEFIRKLFMYTLQLKLKEESNKATNATVASDSLYRQNSGGSMRNKLTSAGSYMSVSSDSSTISFDVFVYTVWSMCSLQPSFFELFVFDVYLSLAAPPGEKVQEQDSLTSEQIQVMIQDIYGGPTCGGNFHAMRSLSILKDNDNIDDYFDIDDFYEFTYHNSVILFAIFSLQTRLQAAICSCSYWDRIGEKRYRTFYGYSSIAEILQWGEFADHSKSSASNSTRRKISTCSLTSQSRFIFDVFRPAAGGDEDSLQGAQCSQQGQSQYNPSGKGWGDVHHMETSTDRLPATSGDAFSCFNPTFTAYSALHRRSSKSNLGVGAGKWVNGIDVNRRRSFDVTVILKESVEKESQREVLAGGAGAGGAVMSRRHSIVT